jgi:hypothetical protein
MTLLNLSATLRRKAASFTPRYQRTPEIIRTFVETGDERCPIAGIWSRLITTDPTLDEPEIAPPVMRTLLPWRASDFLFTFVRYSIA